MATKKKAAPVTKGTPRKTIETSDLLLEKIEKLELDIDHLQDQLTTYIDSDANAYSNLVFDVRELEGRIEDLEFAIDESDEEQPVEVGAAHECLEYEWPDNDDDEIDAPKYEWRDGKLVDTKRQLPTTLNEYADKCHTAALDNGWWAYHDGGPDAATFDSMAKEISDKLLMIHAEVSEATEELRDSGEFCDIEESWQIPPDEKPVGFASEIADILIRTFDLAGAVGIDLDAEVNKKVEYNKTRGHRHGGKRI
jgi:NTP pyrophosphatase (non-canonical NTP hydrolase)